MAASGLDRRRGSLALRVRVVTELRLRAALPPRQAEPGLREAAQRREDAEEVVADYEAQLHEAWSETGEQPSDDQEQERGRLANELGEAILALRAALRTEPQPPIDVERLARAIAGGWPDSFSPQGYGDPRWQRALAEVLAARYDRAEAPKP